MMTARTGHTGTPPALRGALLAACAVACGCPTSHRVETDSDTEPEEPDLGSRDASDTDDAPPLDDASALDDTSARDDGIPSDDECPATVGSGATTATVRWVHVERGMWPDDGSAGLAVGDGIVVAFLPSAGLVQGVLLAADTGEVRSFPEYCFEPVPSTAVGALTTTVGIGFVAAQPREEDGSLPFVACLFDPDGGSLLQAGGPGFGRGVRAGTVTSLFLQAVGPDEGCWLCAYAAAGGATEGGEWSVDAMLWGGPVSMRALPLHSGALPRASESFVAAAGNADAGDDPALVRVLWSAPATLELRDATGLLVARAALDGTARSAPVAAIAPARVDSGFLVVRRVGAAGGGPAVAVERRANADLTVTASSLAADWETATLSPEPRALAGDHGSFALLWDASRARSGGSTPECLYAAAVREDAVPDSAAVRLDDSTPAGPSVPLEFVRAVMQGRSVFAVWRRAPDLWLARVDLAP